jgi:hypothetical protein
MASPLAAAPRLSFPMFLKNRSSGGVCDSFQDLIVLQHLSVPRKDRKFVSGIEFETTQDAAVYPYYESGKHSDLAGTTKL